MDLPTCPSCRQSVLDDDAEVCPFCGAPMKAGAAAQTGRGAARPGGTPPRPATRPDSKGGGGGVGSKPSTSQGSPSLPGNAGRANPVKQPAAASSAVPSGTIPGQIPGQTAGQSGQRKPLSDSARPQQSVPFDPNEDPLDVKTAAGKDAIPASRQRTKSKPYKVTCPMCETVGYVPASAAGKEIRCANPKCLVPVFAAPRIQRKAAEPTAPKSGLPLVLVGLLGALLVLGGAGAWYIYNQPSPSNTQGPGPAPGVAGPGTAINNTTNNTAKGEAANSNAVSPSDQPGNPPVVEKQLTLAEEREPALAIMADATQEKERNLRPPYCQRVTAQTAADCGDLARARTFLDLLAQGTRELAFYRVGPLTAIAWQQLKTADKTAAGKTLDEALAAADEHFTGSYSVNTAPWLAAALVADGRDKEAQTLAARFPANGPTGHLAAVMATAAAWNTWDTVAARRERPLLDVDSLQCPMVVEIAVSRGFAAEALRFAESLPDPALRTECQIAWGEAVARGAEQTKSPAPVAVDPVLEKLKPAARARLQARLGIVRLRGNDRAQAGKFLDSAIASLGNVAAKEALIIPSFKKLAGFEFPDPAPARLNALALAEIARLEGAMDKRDDARKHLALAIAVLRASAPNEIAAREKREGAERLRVQELEEAVPEKGRKEVRAAARSRNLERARVALGRVQATSKTLLAAAQARFALQTEILETALAWDDPGHLWQEIAPQATAAETEQRESYFKTALPWQLVVNLRRAGDKATADKISAAAGDDPPAAVLLDLLAQKATKTDISALARQMQEIHGAEREERERATLAGSSYLLHAGKVQEAFDFVQLFNDPLVKEESLEWTAALACRLNFTRQTKAILKAAAFIPTESVSAYRGFLLGVMAREVAPAAVPPADVTDKPAAADPKRSL